MFYSLCRVHPLLPELHPRYYVVQTVLKILAESAVSVVLRVVLTNTGGTHGQQALLVATKILYFVTRVEYTADDDLWKGVLHSLLLIPTDPPHFNLPI